MPPPTSAALTRVIVVVAPSFRFLPPALAADSPQVPALLCAPSVAPFADDARFVDLLFAPALFVFVEDGPDDDLVSLFPTARCAVVVVSSSPKKFNIKERIIQSQK